MSRATTPTLPRRPVKRKRKVPAKWWVTIKGKGPQAVARVWVRWGKERHLWHTAHNKHGYFDSWDRYKAWRAGRSAARVGIAIHGGAL